MTEPHSPSAVSFSRLTKSYRVGHVFQKRKTVLHELTFEVERGEIFGYLGPNGSGKTTTLKVLNGLLFADSGEVRVLGLPHADRSWRRRAGYLPEHPYLYDYLTAREYLDYVGRLFGMPRKSRADRAAELLRLVGLERSADVALRRFSKGMVQRAGLAQALMNDPELVVLDEPMSGLDPLGRRLVRDIILALKKQGKTILFSTHILSDAETLCDRIAILRAGRLVDVGRLADILTLDVAHMEVLVSGVDPARLALEGVHDSHPLGERHRLHVDEKALGSVVRGLEQAGGRILSVQPVRQSLEDFFFQEMGGPDAVGSWGGGD
jgi:ABC-2 type transport system ATP-binding protein